MSFGTRKIFYAPQYIRRFRKPLAHPQDFPLGRIVLLVLCSLSTAWLVFLSYPKSAHAGLAWLAWVPFIWGVLKIRHFWSAFFYGWITAFLFHAGLFYWIYYTCLHGGGLSVVLSAVAWLGLCAVLSLQYALLGGSYYFLQKTGFLFPLLAACGFVVLEWLHQLVAFYGLGFPWLMWGYTQWNIPQTIQLASYVGVYGVSFVLILTSALIGWALSRARFRYIVSCGLLASASWLGLCWWGDNRLAAQEWSSSSAKSLQAAIVQPNIDQYKKWNAAFEQEIVDTISQFGDELENQAVSLAVWPESVTPGDLSEERYFDLLQDVAVRSGAYQVIGSSVLQENRQYVGAYLMAPFAQSLQVYKKVKLVPFGEYIPLEKWVRRLFPQVAILGELGAFTPGERSQKLLQMGNILLGSTICYESIFPQLWRAQAKQGAQLFVNLTNDAWFFDTAAPHQHLAANVLRAVETGRPVLRAANTGISASISSVGRIEQRSGLFTRTWLQAQVPLQSATTPNFYVLHGDWFMWVCAVFFFTALIFSMVFMYE